MFSDLAGFTSMSERLGPQDTVKLLNRYFDGVTEIVQNRRGGYLNKFLGDGIFVFFGAPIFQEDHPGRAINAAIDCQEEVINLNRKLEEETSKPSSLSVRIGITTGEAMVGNCGSSERFDYTAIGDPVNLSSRLESACKFFGSRIIVDERTWKEGCEGLVGRPLGRIFIAGVREPVRAFEVFGRKEDVDPEILWTVPEFTMAMDKVMERNFEGAMRHLESAQKHAEDDKACRIYTDFCRLHLRHKDGEEPPEIKDPNGVVRLNWIEASGKE
jgi:adenylate cyclase